jgi:hypothetical protein
MTAQATPDRGVPRRRANDAFISGCDRIDGRYTLIARAESQRFFMSHLQ